MTSALSVAEYELPVHGHGLPAAQTDVVMPIGHLYRKIALHLTQMIASGALQGGQRLPSVRDAATQNNVSVATVVQAYRYLEEHGLVQPRPKAGYFVAVAGRSKAHELLADTVPGARPGAALSAAAAPRATVGVKAAPAVVSFAGYSPRDKEFFYNDRIRVAMSRAVRLRRNTLTEYTSSPGTQALRNAVALRALHLGCALQADEIVVTSGCIHAVYLCLLAVTRPGDMVAIESPTFFGFLDLFESLGLRPFELPTHPRTGVSLPALQLALETQPIRAVLLVPTLSNPLGAVMPLTQKRALARMMAHYKIPLIEDVVFNDLLATDARRRAVKAYDTDGWVLTCGSFSKTVSPGVRLGWIAAGRWVKAIATLKRVQGASTNAVLEYALADLLTQGSYEAHLRRLCALMKQRLGQARRIISASFPRGSRVSDPPAGYTRWVELPTTVDGMVLYLRCREIGITLGPGQLFCASQRYRHYVRLSFAGAWGPTEHVALAEIGRQACIQESTAPAVPRIDDQDGSRTDLMSDRRITAHDLW